MSGNVTRFITLNTKVAGESSKLVTKVVFCFFYKIQTNKIQKVEAMPSAGQHELRGFLSPSLQLELFSSYFKFLQQKVPYFNVLRQKYHILKLKEGIVNMYTKGYEV